MTFFLDLGHKMVAGPNRKRLDAVLIFSGWFAMGAFAASTIEHHFNLSQLSEPATALVGGVLASMAAIASKAV
jgi:hypothetical protein